MICLKWLPGFEWEKYRHKVLICRIYPDAGYKLYSLIVQYPIIINNAAKKGKMFFVCYRKT